MLGLCYKTLKMYFMLQHPGEPEERMMLPCQEHICVFAREMDVLISTDGETEGGEPSIPALVKLPRGVENWH